MSEAIDPSEFVLDASEVPLPELDRFKPEVFEPCHTFEPIGDRLLVKRVDPSALSKGGLFIPEGAQATDRPFEGRVAAIGRGVDQALVSVGDQVVFGKFAGDKVDVDGKEFLVMRTDEVLGIRKL